MENKFQKLLFKWLNETATGSSISQLLFLFLSLLSWPFVYIPFWPCMHRCHSAPTLAPSSLSALLCSAQLESLPPSVAPFDGSVSYRVERYAHKDLFHRILASLWESVHFSLISSYKIELIFHYCITIPNMIHDALRPDDTCITINLDDRRGQQLELTPA